MGPDGRVAGAGRDVRDRRRLWRLAAIVALAVAGASIAVWIVARGDLVGADARAYWGGVRLWLGGGDPLDPPPPYLPYVYFPWSLPIFLPWAALPWETAWFVYRMVNVLLFAWSAWWAYQRHPVATAVLVVLITPALAATFDTGNITFLCAMGVWAAHFTGPRLGGLMWALATALKWFPVLLIVVLPPRARLWGLGWLALMGILTLAIWPVAERQLGIVIDFPRPVRIDYILLAWAAVPWLWAHPRWLDARGWPELLSTARGGTSAALLAWWGRPDRARTGWRSLRLTVGRWLGLRPARPAGERPVEAPRTGARVPTGSPGPSS